MLDQHHNHHIIVINNVILTLGNSFFRNKLLVNVPGSYEAKYLGLQNRLWVIDDALVLHHIQLADLLLSLLIQFIFSDFPNQVFGDPFSGLIDWDEILFSEELFGKDVVKHWFVQ